MWRKAKSTGSLFVQNVDSVFVSSDHSADDIWKRRLKRRIQAGEFGITLQSVLPQKMIPLSWKRQAVVSQVEDTISSMSVNEMNESSEDLVKCSTIGLIDPNSLHLVAESLKSPKMSCQEDDMHYGFEEFFKSEQTSVGDNILLRDLELSTARSDLDLDEAPTPVNSEVLEYDNPGFLSSVDLKKDLEKWKGERHSSEDLHSETCYPGSTPITLKSDLTATIRSSVTEERRVAVRSDCNETGSIPDFKHLNQTIPENRDRMEPTKDTHSSSSSPKSFNSKTSHSGQELLQDIQAVETDDVDPAKELQSQCPQEHSMCTCTTVYTTARGGVCDGCGRNLNNSGRGKVGKKFVNKVTPEDVDSNNHSLSSNSGKVKIVKKSSNKITPEYVDNNSHSHSSNSGKGKVVQKLTNKVSPENVDINNHSQSNTEKDQKRNKFIGITNMVYQPSLESIQSQSMNRNDAKSTSESAEKVNLQMKKEKSFLKGGDGFKHYKLFAMVEKAVNIKRMENMKKNLLDDYRWRKTIVDELKGVAKAYYLDPTGPGRKRWKTLRQEIDQHSMHSLTDTRVKLASVSQFFPYFTCIIILLQLLLLAIMTTQNGIADIDVASRLMLQENTSTFLGKETVDKWKEVNMWIGPSSRYLIGMGGILSICMRDEHSLIMHGIAQNYSIDYTLGCCEIAARNTAGTTTREECQFLSLGVGQWRNVTCNSRPTGNNSVQHVLKPCCLDHKGSCSLLSNEHCTFLGGVFHVAGEEHCSQVSCPSRICQMGGMSSLTAKPWLSASYQWWRPLVSLLYSHGGVHLLMVVIGEWLLMRQVERSAGWLRVTIIYTMCGVTGGMCASVFSPYSPQVGTTAVVLGSLGVIHMELIEGWKLIPKPWLELLKIYSILIFAIFSGTLPNVSNAAIITGFITGLLSAVAFLPYINLGLWSKKSRRAAVIASLVLLFLVFFIIIYSFHKVQSLRFCEWCRIFDCVNYTANMCTHTSATA